MKTTLTDLLLKRPLAWCVALAAVAVGGYFAAELYLLGGRVGFPLDDSWIHLQFARNLAAGEGLSYNAGELVTGSTAPLWTAILSLVFILPGSAAMWAKVLGILCFLGIVPATFRLARELGVRRELAALAAALTATTSWLVWSALSGMEIPLFTLLSVIGLTLHLRERRGDRVPFSAVVFGLAALCRPEGLVLVVGALLDRGLSLWLPAEPDDRRQAWRQIGLWLLLAAIVLVPTMIFYRVVGGSFLPTTYAAKAPGPQRWLPSLSYLRVVLGIYFPVQPIMTILAGGGVLVLAARFGTRDDRGLLPVLWLLGVPLAYGLVSPLGPAVVVGNLGRYYFPFLPVVIVMGVLAIDAAWHVGRSAESTAARRMVAVVGILLILATSLASLGRGGRAYLQHIANVEDSDVAMARWLDGRLPKEALLAVNDIGALKYMLPNPVVDLAGIAHPEARDQIARAEATGFAWYEGLEWFLEAHEPDYLIVFPAFFPPLVADQTKFRPLHRIVISDNVTMGGDELVLYSTPWTRYPLRR